MITNGRHSFAMFLYDKIEWTTGTASGGSSSTGLGGTPAQVISCKYMILKSEYIKSSHNDIGINFS